MAVRSWLQLPLDTHSVMPAHNIGICGRTISAQCVNIYEGLRRGVGGGGV